MKTVVIPAVAGGEDDGLIGHGTKPLRWRTDKSPRQCTLDQLETAGSVLGLLES
jgi:hypothetical protein